MINGAGAAQIPDYPPGIGRTGMISTRSPGKIAKCGWFSNSFAAASCEPARTTVEAPISLAMSAIPLESIFLVLPIGPPMATIAAWCFSTQAFRAAMPCCSLTCLVPGGRAFFRPGARLLARRHIDHPVAAEHFLGLGEGAVGDDRLAGGEGDPGARRWRVQPVERDQHAGVFQRLVVFHHRLDPFG